MDPDNRVQAAFLVRVSNLDSCRTFYRDVIGLGAPVLDSSCWVEFRSGGMTILLEKCEWGEKVPPASGRIAFMLTVDSFQVFFKRLADAGYPEGSDSADRFGYRVKCCSDPEGNLFYVTERKTEGV